MEDNMENILPSTSSIIHTMCLPRRRTRQQFSLCVSPAPEEEVEAFDALEGIFIIIIILMF